MIRFASTQGNAWGYWGDGVFHTPELHVRMKFRMAFKQRCGTAALGEVIIKAADGIRRLHGIEYTPGKQTADAIGGFTAQPGAPPGAGLQP